MSDEPKGRKRRSPASCCGTGCVGALIVFVVLFTVAYSFTGKYQPVLPPQPPVPSPNALDDYIAAGQMFKANGGSKPMYGPDGEPVLLSESAVVQANLPVLAQLRAGLTKECRVPFTGDFAVTFPYLADMRDLARLLSAEADVYAAGGNREHALESGLDAIQMGSDLQRGGTLLHGLVGVAIQAIGQQSMLSRIDRLKRKDCDRLIPRMQKILKNRVPPYEILQQERVWALTTLTKMKDSDFAQPTQSLDDEEPAGGSNSVTKGLIWHFMRDKTIRDLEKYYDALNAEAKKPRSQRVPLPEPGGLAGIFAPVFEGATSSFEIMETRNRLTLCAIALRKYFLKYDKLPATLKELGLDPTLLEDPFSGGELKYLPKGENYLLYSVGEDGKDDGGVPANEVISPQIGDIGISFFAYYSQSGTSQKKKSYRLVPHMLPPKLPAGSPPLNP
jgi:hypothetical protein